MLRELASGAERGMQALHTAELYCRVTTSLDVLNDGSVRPEEPAARMLRELVFKIPQANSIAFDADSATYGDGERQSRRPSAMPIRTSVLGSGTAVGRSRCRKELPPLAAEGWCRADDLREGERGDAATGCAALIDGEVDAVGVLHEQIDPRGVVRIDLRPRSPSGPLIALPPVRGKRAPPAKTRLLAVRGAAWRRRCRACRCSCCPDGSPIGVDDVGTRDTVDGRSAARERRKGEAGGGVIGIRAKQRVDRRGATSACRCRSSRSRACRRSWSRCHRRVGRCSL